MNHEGIGRQCFLFAVVVFLGSAGALRAADPALTPQQLDFFESRIRPIFSENCYKCHSQSSEKIKGGLLLDSRDGVLKGGETGPAIVPGNVEKSLLIKAIRYTDKDLQMPPAEKKLSSAQIADLEAWVKMGAPDPRKEGTGHSYQVDMETAKKHWAFKPISNPEPPQVPDPKGWIQTPVDNFILGKLMENKLTPAAPADKVTLLRRATFDLIGLPPTPKELQDFLADESTDAFAKVVDRLLASPHYGERWGRYWLDIAHFADTKGQIGGQRDNRYLYAYTYRDYVIRAFNNDLPYDQFLIQQIAADCLPQTDDKRTLAAMGFLTLGNRFGNQANDIIDDRIDIVGKGTLGLTLNCARCHDHKFDPIPTQDYYSLHGIFNSSSEPAEGPEIEKPKDQALYKDFQKQLAIREAALDQFNDELAKLAAAEVIGKAGDYLLALHDYKSASPDVPRNVFFEKRGLLGRQAGPWESTLKAAARKHSPILAAWLAFEALDDADFANQAKEVSARIYANENLLKPHNPIIARMFATPPASLAQVAARYSIIFNETEKRWQSVMTAYEARRKVASVMPDTPLALEDAGYEQVRQFLYAKNSPTFLDEAKISSIAQRDNKNRDRLAALERAISDLKLEHPGAPAHANVLLDLAKGKDSTVFIKGNAGNRGPVAPRRFLQVLSPDPRPLFKEGSGRLELAKAIASPDNPLTARVMVNRIWLHHFGEGLARNPDDFGTRSDPPTHPELLDYLASQFITNGWSVKKMHRLIMLSSVYQESSDETARYFQIDPDNRFLWHMNRRRLDFEALRDSILMIGGKLDLTVGGQPVHLDSEPYPTRRSVYGYIDRANLPNMLVALDFPSPDLTTGRRDTTIVPQQALWLMNSPLVVEQARDLTKRSDFRSAGSEKEKITLLYTLIYQRAPADLELKLAHNFLSAEPASQRAAAAQTAWRYGFGEYDPFTKRMKLFAPMSTFSSKNWAPDSRTTDKKAAGAFLSSDGGRPGKQYPVVRRWTAPRDGLISIDGLLSHAAKEGDGVEGKIVSSRQGLLRDWVVFNTKTPTKIPALAVQQDETIDFVVDPRMTPNGDLFAWAPIIRMNGDAKSGQQALEWNAKKDFTGDQEGRNMDAWEKFAQVLFESNELAFVN